MSENKKSESDKKTISFVEETTCFKFEEIKKILELGDVDNQEELISWVNSFDYSIEGKMNLISKLGKILNKDNVKKQIKEFKRKFEMENDEHEKMQKIRSEKISRELIRYSGVIDFNNGHSVKRIILELKCKESILGKCFKNLISYYNQIRKEIFIMEKEINNINIFFKNLDEDHIHKSQNKTDEINEV